MAELHVVRVFCGPGGAGNPLGVFLEGSEVDEADRQGVATDLGFAETVFVDDSERGEMRIFAPGSEVPFAGHPVVGTAWLLARTSGEVVALHPPAGEVRVREADGLTYAAGRPEWSPEWEFVELATPAEVEALDGPPAGKDAVSVWAWSDEGAGLVRARVFAPRFGIPEDEATGSAAINLCARLGRRLDIRQGEGSQIYAEPLADGRVEIGGRVELEDVREHPGAG
jgi:predicted PhzF superfamily epimerase YddE/YHI9